MPFLIGLGIVAFGLAAAAIGLFVASAGVAAGGPATLAKGQSEKMDARGKRDDLVRRLRWASLICLVLLGADGVAIYTFINYVNP